MNRDTKIYKNKITKELEKKYEQNQAEAISWWLIEHVTHLEKETIILESDHKLTETQAKWLDNALFEHLEKNKPIQYILGEIEFLDLNIKLEPPILIPRPETEFWVDKLINSISLKKPNIKFNVLDLCTGTGCIGLAIASSFKQAQIDAVDINIQACNLAGRNAEFNKIDNFSVYNSDLYSALPRAKKYSLIVSNPPYIKPSLWLNLDASVKNWEDPVALKADNDGLYLIEKIITQAPNWLEHQPVNGILPQLWLEMDPWQVSIATKLFHDSDFYSITIHQDQYGKDRVIQALLKTDER